MSRRPEDDVLDSIAALVDESLATPYERRSGYDNDIHQPECGLCGDTFHGLLNIYGCPGEFGPPELVEQWRDAQGIAQASWEPLHRASTDQSGSSIQPIPDGPPYVIGRDFRLGGHEPRWITDLLTMATNYVNDTLATVTGIYTNIPPYHQMRSQSVGQYSYREWFENCGADELWTPGGEDRTDGPTTVVEVNDYVPPPPPMLALTAEPIVCADDE